LHHALQTTLGGHAQQQGSKVDRDWLRFDFTNQESLTDEQVKKIEEIANACIDQKAPVSWKLVSLADARKEGAMMLFGEKYPDPVRMVTMGDFSRELCGGIHLDNTQQVQTLEILSEESVSAGTRRITALTGARAAEYRANVEKVAHEASSLLGCTVDGLAETAGNLVTAIRKLKKLNTGTGGEAAPEKVGRQVVAPKASAAGVNYLLARNAVRNVCRAINVQMEEVASRIKTLLADQDSLHHQLSNMSAGSTLTIDDLLKLSEMVGDVRLVVAETPGANPGIMRQWIDQLRKDSDVPVAVLLGCKADEDKVTLIAAISPALVQRKLSAGKWIGPVAAIVGGGGGGKPDLAQAGGKHPEKLSEAIAAAKQVFKDMLKS
jgi:alanyl-tRNA synthetase